MVKQQPRQFKIRLDFYYFSQEQYFFSLLKWKQQTWKVMEQTEIVMFIVRKVAWHLITFKKLCLTKNIYYTINVIAHRKSIITCISLIHFNTSCLGTFKFFHRLNTTLYLSFSFFSDAFLKTTRITTAASVSLSSPRIRSNVSPTFTWRGGKGGGGEKNYPGFFFLEQLYE